MSQWRGQWCLRSSGNGVDRIGGVKRWAWNILAGLSLLVCVAIVALWVRSHWRADVVGAQSAIAPDGRQRGGSVDVARGSLGVHYWSRRYTGPTPPRPEPRAFE